jgi:hypothetical protein
LAGDINSTNLLVNIRIRQWFEMQLDVCAINEVCWDGT